LWAWGWNEYGQVASGETADFFDVPRTVTALQGTVFVAAGFQHSFAIRSIAT
jgi:alpha-tubulin suppressor-like RCC1 family protein